MHRVLAVWWIKIAGLGVGISELGRCCDLESVKRERGEWCLVSAM